ncbi:MAG: efflux RND transporter periplasmic adaptor subunit [Steroidobacteraceae bacterium]
MRRISVITLLVVAAFAVGGGLWAFWPGRNKVPVFLTTPVKRGDLVATISATGTVEPEAAVDIGAQVAGVIVAFGKDKDGKPVNWGSVVDAGTVLARIDDSLYGAAVKTAKAQLDQGKANVLASQANLLQQKANLLYATQNWERAEKLGPSDALAKSAYDQYQANYEVAKANLAAAEAAVEQTKAAVEQDQANLLTAQINLDYCTIKSPVKGVVIDRRVNIGQTVVSSLSAPSLFLIANDLSRIQVWVSVNEADVGNISAGQTVTFTVDAFPGRVFQGRVGQVRLNATMTQNVVTYTIEVDIDNSDGRLLPYLTANALFETGRRKGVLLLPNAALRWSPRSDQIAPDLRQSHVQASRGAHGSDEGGVHTVVWIEDGKFVRPIPVRLGLTDGTFTEVEGNGLREGLRAVIGEGTPEVQSAETAERNPFAPQIFRAQHSGQEQAQGNPEQRNPEQANPSSGTSR